MSKGIDYSGRGSTVNRDPDTGIRYGVIPLARLNEWAYDSFEQEYDPCCPKCGDDLPEDAPRVYTRGKGERIECPSCGEWISEDETTGDEPSRTVLKDGEHEGMLGSDGDVWIFKSPFFTRAAFCSPCAPGACYLTSPCDDGERAYCLGPDWFDEENPAPYPIYSVATGERV